jgi:hypothetical protein
MLQYPLDQPRRQRREVQGQRRTKSQIGLDLQEMGSPRGQAAPIRREDIWWQSQLLGHEGHDSPWSCPKVTGGKTQIAQRTELERKAQLIVGATLFADFLRISVG